MSEKFPSGKEKLQTNNHSLKNCRFYTVNRRYRSENKARIMPKWKDKSLPFLFIDDYVIFSGQHNILKENWQKKF